MNSDDMGRAGGHKIDAFSYVYNWSNNSKRKTLNGRRCRILSSGRKNSVCIEFENGQCEIVSRYAVKRAPKENLLF